GSAGYTSSAPAATVEEKTPAAVAAAPAASNGAASAPASDGRVVASPLARKIAKELGLDLAAIKGTGPGGRIIERDVKGAQPVS
ncbi:E3 binding domain-containing protein, partial [Enterococcus faecium]